MSEKCTEKPCEPCACSGMGTEPHCMYCMCDLTAEMEAKWRRAVIAAGKSDPCPGRAMPKENDKGA